MQQRYRRAPQFQANNKQENDLHEGVGCSIADDC